MKRSGAVARKKMTNLSSGKGDEHETHLFDFITADERSAGIGFFIGRFR